MQRPLAWSNEQVGGPQRRAWCLEGSWGLAGEVEGALGQGVDGVSGRHYSADVRSRIWARGLPLGIGVEEVRCTDDPWREKSGAHMEPWRVEQWSQNGEVSGTGGPQGTWSPGS